MNKEDVKNMKLFSRLRTKVSITKELGIYILVFNALLIKFFSQQNPINNLSLAISIISFLFLVLYLKYRIEAQSLVEHLIKEEIYRKEINKNRTKENKNTEKDSLWRELSVTKYNDIMKRLKENFKLYYYFYLFENIGLFFLFLAMFSNYIGKIIFSKEGKMNLQAFSLTQIVLVLSLIIAFIGLLLNLIINSRNSKKQRAEILNKIFDDFYFNKDIRDVFYKVEYNEFIYDEKKFHGSCLEKQTDQLLAFLNKLGRLYELKMLSSKEIIMFKYEILRVFKNNEIKKYFKFLDSWYKNIKVGTKPFQGFRSLAEKLEKY